MSDTFTSSLRLQLQQTGANANTWGNIANTDFSLIEAAITGDNGFAGGSGPGISIDGLTSYTMTANNGSADQSREALYAFTGALAGDCTVTIPAVVKIGWACNDTSGSKSVILTTGSGTSLTLYNTNNPNAIGLVGGPKVWTLFYCDGTNVNGISFTTQVQAFYAGWIAQGTNINIAANGTTLGAATKLTAAWNIIGSASPTNYAIGLNNLQPLGSATFIINQTSQMLDLFPGDGSSIINVIAAGDPYPIAPWAQGNPGLVVAVRTGGTQWYVTGGWLGTSVAGYTASGASLAAATVTSTQLSFISGGTGGVVPIDTTPQNVKLDYLNYTGSGVNLYPSTGSGTINALSAGTAISIPALSAGLPGVLHMIRLSTNQWFAWTG